METSDSAPPLKLRVPEPSARPENSTQAPSLDLPEPGEVRKPAIDEDPAAIRDLAFSLIRVLYERLMPLTQVHLHVVVGASPAI